MVSQSRVSKLLKDLTYSESSSEVPELGSIVSVQSDSGVSSDCSLTSTPSSVEEAFLERLRSFETIKWFAKPVEISPIACARLGWRCTATNKLQCISCCEELLVDDSSLNSNWAVIQQAHNPICKWPSNVVPNSITLKTESVLNVFSHNLQLMPHLSNDDDWRNIQIELPPSFDQFKSEYEDATAYLGSLSENSDDEDLVKKIILISIFGWKMSKSGKMLQCNKCSRRMSTSLIISAGGNVFNPEQQHFYWCSWICPYFKEPPAWVKQLKRSRKSPAKSPRIDNSISPGSEDGAQSVRTVRNIFKDLE